MRRNLFVLSGAVLTVGAAWAGSVQAKEVSEMNAKLQSNLVSNGGFEAEADGDGMPDGWELDVDSNDVLFRGKLSTQSHSGRYSFCAEKGRGSRGTYLHSPSFDLKPNAAYEVSVWLRIDSRFPKDTVRLRVRANTHSELFDLSVKRAWRKSTVLFRTASGTTSGNVRFDQLGGLAERLYIDDVEIRETEAEEAGPEGNASGPEGRIEAPLAADGSLAGVNKIANGGFEINHKTHAEIEAPWECWNSYYWAKFRPAYEYDGEVVHSGKYSIRIPQENWANEATRDGWIEQKVSGVGANKTYTLSAWVKSSLEPTRVRLCIYGWNPAWGRDFEGGVSPRFNVGTEWQRISWTRRFGPKITDVYVMVKREHQVLGGDVWIDDVQLEEGGEATDFTADAWTEGVQR